MSEVGNRAVEQSTDKTYVPKRAYGTGDVSYQTAGRLDGIAKLVDAFYAYMDALPEAAEIRAMHEAELSESKKKLTYFLSGWMGGPRLYREHYGEISIPLAHRHLDADLSHAKAWMLCMQSALGDQDYPVEFKQYLYDQLSVPAKRIVQVGGCEPT